jgi:pilus assembly protein FimV
MSENMHNYKRLKLSSMGRNVLSAAIASSLLMLSTAHATGLGKLRVLSSLGQPLQAEIELTSPNKDEVGALVPKVASIEKFKQANIEFNPALLSIRFVVEPRGSGHVIKLSSSQAMNEPFVDLLVELNSSSGLLVREYTFLLDPPELRTSQSAQIANPVSVGSQTSTQVTPQSNSAEKSGSGSTGSSGSANTKKNIAKPSPAEKLAANSGDYEVKRGDTLSKIASAYKSEGVSLDQMLVGIYRANPQAFDGSNMNRLKVGQVLSIPDSETLRSTNGSEARTVVQTHAADFSAYRNKLAGQVEDAPVRKSRPSKQTASGAVTAKVNEVPTASNEAIDRLKLSKAAGDVPTKPGVTKQIEEERLAKDKAIAEANARVKELEKNVDTLRNLLDVKNKDLADKQAAAAKAPKKEEVPLQQPAQPAVVSQPTKQVDSPPPVVATPAPVATAPAASSAPAAASTPAKRKVAPPPAPPEPGFVDRILDSGYLLWAAVAAAVIAGLGILNSRRKKKSEHFDDSILTGSSMKANSMFGSTGGQSVDTNNSVFNSNFAPSASQLDANEVDPVAEADVYIAYGRDSQAEEILKEALRTQPERHAVRVKLLEIYQNRKDTKSFERLASELYGMTNGEGEEWAQAASMGMALEPTNPLYAGGKLPPSLETNSALGMATQPMEDLDPEALLGNSLSDDMLDSISIIDTATGLNDDSITSPAKSAESMKTAEGNESGLDIGSLDFDLGALDVPEQDSMNAPLIPDEKASKKTPPPEHKEEMTSVDFETIDFDLGDDSMANDVKKPAVAENMSSFQIDLPVDHEDKTSNSLDFTSANDHAEKGIDSNNDLLVVGSHDNASKESEAAVSAFEFDLSGIDLNLDSKAPVEIEHAPSLVDDAPTFNAEMATKLDLAVAYHEIGDKEGARELLDEVVKGGTADQIEKARQMLEKLS